MPAAAGMLICSSLSGQGQAQLSPLELAEEAFSKSSYDLALEKYNVIIQNPFAPSRDLALSRCRVGVIQSIRNDFKESRKNLELAVSSNAVPKNVTSLCHYALLQIYVLDSANAEARELIKKMGEPSFSVVYVARTWALASEIGKRLQDNKFEVIHLQKLLNVMEKSKLQSVDIRILENRKVTLTEVRARLGLDNPDPLLQTSQAALSLNSTKLQGRRTASNQSVQGELTAVPASSASSSAGASTGAPTSSPFLQNSGSNSASPSRQKMSAVPDNGGPELVAKISQGDNAAALAILKSLPSASAQKELLNSVGIGTAPERILGRLESLSKDNPRHMRIGIILPAGSPLTRFKNRVLKSISAFANSSAVQEVSYSFYVRGIQGDTGAAESAALNLLLNEHVHAIVGPISAPQVLGVSESAALFGVPVFALGPVAHAAEFDSSVLTRMGVLAKSQSLAHINHIKNELRFKTAAVFAPDDAYGFEMARAFSEAGKEKNIEITKTTYFNVNTDVFQESVVDAMGPQDAESRKEEFRKASFELRKKAQAEKRKFDPSEVKLPPRITFDALFIPDALSKVKVISSTFAFNDAKNVNYLGDKFWAEGVGRSSLADQFLNGSRIPALSTGSFLSHLRREIGVNDGPLDLERQSFDALVFIRQAQYKASGGNGPKMLKSMRSADWTAEGTSVFSGPVDKYGEPSARMFLYGYKGGKLSPELEPWSRNEDIQE